MALAAGRLVGSDDALAEIASRVGYGSEFAFAKAFKRHHGVAPGAYRREAWNGAANFARPPRPTMRCAA